MQPYPNPNYYGQYQQQQYNPYIQRMENLQQFQQSLQPTQISVQNQPFTPLGKIVESIDIVKATDIPMDGNMYYFPKADGSEVYSKNWLPNGTTQILTFKPSFESATSNLSSEEEKMNFDTFNAFLEGIQADIKLLTDKVDKISKTNRAKKEVSEDE